MKLLGRSGGDEPDPGEVRRVTGAPGATDSVTRDGDLGSSAHAATPVSGRLQRLAQVVDRSTSRRTDRDLRKILQLIGMLAIAFGFVCIVLGWYGAAHSPYQYEEIPYVISGGLLGVALVIGGGVLVLCAWSLRQVEEARRNAVAIVRSIDRLERALQDYGDTGASDDLFKEDRGA
jgi:uncharacterized membrane protein